MGLEGPKQGLGCSRCAPGCQIVSAGAFVLTSLLSLRELGTAAGASSISASVEEDFSLPCSHQGTLGKVLVPWHGHLSSLDHSPWPVAGRGDDGSSVTGLGEGEAPQSGVALTHSLGDHECGVASATCYS